MNIQTNKKKSLVFVVFFNSVKGRSISKLAFNYYILLYPRYTDISKMVCDKDIFIYFLFSYYVVTVRSKDIENQLYARNNNR